MSTPHSIDSSSQKPLRLWPGVVAVTVQWLLWFALPLVAPTMTTVGFLGGMACGLIVLVWWLLFSRAPWIERVGVLAFMVVAVAATRFVVDRSIENGYMGLMLMIYSIPAMSLALVAALVITRRSPVGSRRAWIGTAVVIACAAFTLIRTDGVTGEGVSMIHWRWTPTAEERLLAQAGSDPTPPAAPAPTPPVATDPPVVTPTGQTAEKPVDPAPGKPAVDATIATVAPDAAPASAEWPGFRGAQRDSVVRGIRIETDWARKPPTELWRRPIGPGWSSFAVQGDLLYTQEQRGDHELVTCYRLSSGEPVWTHRDAARFYESNGGPGPRATPTLHQGRVYTLGATGIVNSLDARTGRVIWTRNGMNDTGATPPGWGFAGSPLVIGDAVVFAISGRLVSYDLATGNPRWTRATRAGGYSSPHFATIGGVPQILIQSGGGVTAVAPADGAVLWEHLYEVGVNIVQPAFAENGDLLLTSGDAMGGLGIRRIAVSRDGAGWKVEERWTSRGLKPYFNDFVVHKGHAFGFDGSILSCIDLADGTRKWKGGRYGHGQMILLPEQDLMLVLAEEGDLALVKATGDQFTEVARLPALEDKTWNHPVLIGDVLVIRNGQEMVAFRLGQ